MPGVFGLTFRASALSDDQVAILKDEIAKYKTVRDIVAQSNAILLSDQAPVDDASWEVLEEIADDQASGVDVRLQSQRGRRAAPRPAARAAAATSSTTSAHSMSARSAP